MKRLTTLCCLAIAVAPAAAKRPDKSQLNGKHHRLRIQARPFEGGVSALDAETVDELTRFAVGADVSVRIPSFLGTGHGPFTDVYANQPPSAPPKATAKSGLTITKAFAPETFIVRCTRAGVFELAIEVVGLDGKRMTDAVDIGCITPTRFDATLLPSNEGSRYLAGGSEVLASLEWFGRRANGIEVPLLGTLPVEVPIDSPLAVTAQDTTVRLRALRAATSPTISSVGHEVTLPIEIVEPASWNLDVAITTKKQMTTIRVRAFDDQKRPLAGLAGCEISSFTGDAETARGTGCGRLLSNRRLLEWKADRVCVTLQSETACVATP